MSHTRALTSLLSSLLTLLLLSCQASPPELKQAPKAEGPVSERSRSAEDPSAAERSTATSAQAREPLDDEEPAVSSSQAQPIDQLTGSLNSGLIVGSQGVTTAQGELGLVGVGSGGGGRGSGPDLTSTRKSSARRAGPPRASRSPKKKTAKNRRSLTASRSRRVSAKSEAGRGGVSAYSRQSGLRYPHMSTSALRDQIHGYLSSVDSQPLSTFSMDVDRTSYNRLRGALKMSRGIPSYELKIEGFVNAYPYQLEPPPESAPEPFSLSAELSDAPWEPGGGGDMLLRVALKAKELSSQEQPKSNLVLLIDVSGSMCARDKLSLVKQSLSRFIKQLKASDKMSLVTYSGKVRTLLKPTLATQQGKRKIKRAIGRLSCAGKTAGGAGLSRAYELAQEGWVEGGNNRVLVATDGDFNMGISSVDEIKNFIREKRRTGVYLSMLGFGQSGYNDENMGALARSGNGNYAFIDSREEGERALGFELAGTLNTLAHDLKLQVELNPAHVRSYRLLGYEQRRLSSADFANDQKDASELGAGQQITAIYELYTRHQPTPAKIKVSYPCGDRQVASNIDCPDRKGDEGPPPPDRASEREWGVFKVRYKPSIGAESQELSYPIHMGAQPLQAASHDHRVAAALTLLGEALKSSGSVADIKGSSRPYRRGRYLYYREPYTQGSLLKLIKPQDGEELGADQERALKGLRSMLKRIYKLIK